MGCWLCLEREGGSCWSAGLVAGWLEGWQVHSFIHSMQVAHIMRAVIRFIAQCHAKGLIYRDIKPGELVGRA